MSRVGRFSLLLLVVTLACPVHAASSRSIWIDRRLVHGLPVTGPAWRNLKQAADAPTLKPDLADQDSQANVQVLARALVYCRLEEQRYRQEVMRACREVMGSEQGGTTLSLGRELAAYVIAADLVGLDPDLDRSFRRWLGRVRTRVLQGRSLRSTHLDRPNNWGTHAGASLMAIAAFLGERNELDRLATVFRGWLGDRRSYSGFRYRDLSWQADPLHPVGINPRGATKLGHDIDGVLPDDQRRSGPFRWPPPKENYVWEALQGAVVQAVILSRQGYGVWDWEDKALLRAYRWLYEVAGYPPQGDDIWQVYLVNCYYGTDFPAQTPVRPGKNMGWTDWTHGSCRERQAEQ